MGRISSIARLRPEIREAVDGAVAGGRATAAEIVRLVGAMGAKVSESSVARYARAARQRGEAPRCAPRPASLGSIALPAEVEVAIKLALGDGRATLGGIIAALRARHEREQHEARVHAAEIAADWSRRFERQAGTALPSSSVELLTVLLFDALTAGNKRDPEAR